MTVWETIETDQTSLQNWRSMFCWSEVGCRGSRRATTEESDTTPAMGLSGNVCPRLLLTINGTHQNAKSMWCNSDSVERFVRKEYPHVWKDEKLVCRKTSTGSHIEYTKRELFSKTEIVSCILNRQRHGFELLWEIPCSRRRFLAENPYSWRRERIPYIRAADSKHKYVWVLFVFEEQILGERTPFVCSCLIKITKRLKRKEKNVFFSFFWHASNDPALSMCMSLTIRVW